MTDSTALSELRGVLETRGLDAGLMFLNARVPHRYSAVYRLSDAYLRRLGFTDKLGGPGLEFAEVPFKDSYCELAVKQAPMVVTDVVTDPRLDAYPNPGQLMSYVGLPLSVAPGALFGTLCHYDTSAHLLSDAELAFMEQASELLLQFCLRTGVSPHAMATD